GGLRAAGAGEAGGVLESRLRQRKAVRARRGRASRGRREGDSAEARHGGEAGALGGERRRGRGREAVQEMVEDLVTASGGRPEELLDRAYGVGAQATTSAPPAVEANRRGLIVGMGIVQIVLGSIMAVLAICTVAMAAVSTKALTAGAAGTTPSAVPLILAGLV